MSDLASQHCVPCEGGAQALDRDRAEALLAQLPGWSMDDAGREIRREFGFDDFHQTMAFVNAMAWIAHRQDHHPDFETGYRCCMVRYTTHAIGGLSENDFICAARINRLVD